MTEQTKSWIKHHQLATAITIVFILLFITPAFSGLSILGYTQGTQGFSLNFAAVQNPQGTIFTQSSGLNYQLNSNYPTIGGSIQSFTVDMSNSSGLNQVYTWSIQTGSGTINGQPATQWTNFQMDRILCNTSFNIRLSGTGSQAGPTIQGVGSAPDYQNYKIWISVMPNNFLYFQGNPNQVYIAPAYIGLNQNAIIAPISSQNGLSTSGFSSDVATYPQASGDVFPVYYNLGGYATNSSANAPTSQTMYTYIGQQLDPAIFRSQYYIELTLSQFMAQNSYSVGGILGHWWAYPSVQYNIQVYAYVIGTWTTYLTPAQVPKPNTEPVVQGGVATIFSQLIESILNPFGNLSWIVWALILSIATIVMYYVLKNKNNSEEGKSFTKNKYAGLTLFNWGILAILLIADAFDISIVPLDIATDVGTLGYIYWIWKKRKSET